MSERLKDILSNLSIDIEQETLLLYLQDKLSAEKKHEVEKKLINNEFAEDAMEGLHQFGNKKDITQLVEQLNRDLKNKLAKKKRRRDRMRLKEQPWLYMAIIIMLLLIVISFIVIYFMQHQ